jgi:non-heme chloroperoxidase
MQAHSVVGGGGVRLHVVETGNPSGQAILFLHGFSGGHLVWRKQLESDLANDFRLVAMDLRGHGLSDKPRDAYADAGPWAEDVQAVIATLGLEQPVLSGWSFGGVVISDYLRHYGESHVGGLHLVGGNTKLGEPLMPFVGPQWGAEAGGMLANDVEAFVDAAPRFLRLLVKYEPSHEDLVFNLGVCMMVPLYVRQGMFSRTVDNDDVLRTVRKPVLITHGESDAVILPALALHHGAVMPHAQLSWFPNAGHAPHWEDPDRFNNELGTFAERVASVRRVLAT